MKHVLLLAVALMAVVVLTPAAFAQPPDGPSRPPRPPRPAGPLMEQLAGMGEADIRSLVETVRMVKLSRELGLTDEQTVVLVRQYNEAKESGAKLQKERMELARELRELVGAKAPDADLELDIMNFIRKRLSPLAMPQEIEFVDSLPKTRSGKIMRRLLHAKEGGEEIGDTSTLEND